MGHGKGPAPADYLRRFRSQAALISKTTIITMVVTKIGPAKIANIVSILRPPS